MRVQHFRHVQPAHGAEGETEENHKEHLQPKPIVAAQRRESVLCHYLENECCQHGDEGNNSAKSYQVFAAAFPQILLQYLDSVSNYKEHCSAELAKFRQNRKDDDWIRGWVVEPDGVQEVDSRHLLNEYSVDPEKNPFLKNSILVVFGVQGLIVMVDFGLEFEELLHGKILFVYAGDDGSSHIVLAPLQMVDGSLLLEFEEQKHYLQPQHCDQTPKHPAVYGPPLVPSLAVKVALDEHREYRISNN